jgi:hypothetical protein
MTDTTQTNDATANDAAVKSELAKGASIASAAVNFAHDLSKNTAAMQFMATYSENRLTVKNGALTFLSFLRVTYPDNTLLGWPRPGTNAKDNPGLNNLDKATRMGVNARTGKRGPVPVSFYDELSDNTAVGKDACDHLEAISKCRKNPKDNSISADMAKKYSTASVRTFDADESLYQTRKDDFRNLVKRAMLVWFMMADLQNFPKVSVEILTEKDNEGKDIGVRRTGTPIWLESTTEKGVYRALSVTQFLSIDIDAAKSAGGTFEDIIATLGKGADEDDEVEGLPAIPAGDTEAIFDHCAVLAAWFEDVNNVKKLIAAVPKVDGHAALSLYNLSAALESAAHHFEKKAQLEQDRLNKAAA